MPQVAARITEEYEEKLKKFFKTKSAGAEFLLPWVMDTFCRSISQVKGEFSANELKTFVEAYRKNPRLQPEQCRLSYLKLGISEACEDEQLNALYGASWPSIERKLDRLNDVQAAALMVWASAYWTSNYWKDVPMDEYVR